MDIRYKKTTEDYKKAIDILVEYKIDKLFNKNKKIKDFKYKAPLLLFIFPLFSILADGASALKESLEITVIFYILFMCIIQLAYKTIKNIVAKRLKNNAIDTINESQNNMSCENICIARLSDEQLIIESNDCVTKSMLSFVKLIENLGEYIYIEFMDNSFDIIPLKYFEDDEEINRFINIIEDNKDNDIKLEFKVKEKIINTIKYKVDINNLYIELKFISKLDYYKDSVKSIKRCILLFQVILLLFILIIVYLFWESALFIVCIIFTILILYSQLFKLNKLLYKGNEESLKKSWKLNKEYNIYIDDKYIYIYTEYNMIKKRITDRIHCINFEDYSIVIEKNRGILANIPNEGFNSIDDMISFSDKINNEN